MIKQLKFWLLIFILALAVLPILAQGLVLALAVVYQGSLYVMNGVPRFADELQQALTLVSDVPTDDYRAAWSPDGTKLAYTAGNALRVWDGAQSLELATGNFSPAIPLGWTRDGLITYMVSMPSEPGSETVQVYTIAPQPGAAPDLVIDGLPVVLACGSITALPMEAELWTEVAARETLALTDYGLIYPARCGSEISLYRPFSAETVPLAGGAMTSAVLSPDEMRVAGIVSGQSLVVVDLMTMAETTLTTGSTPQVLAWGRDGSLYYASVRQTRNLLDGLDVGQLALFNAFTGATPGNVPGNVVSIFRIAPDGTETRLAEHDAFAVGQMAMKGSTLVYSTIANGDAWVTAMRDGVLTPETPYDTVRGYVPVSVNYLALSETGAVLEAGTIPGALGQVTVTR